MKKIFTRIAMRNKNIKYINICFILRLILHLSTKHFKSIDWLQEIVGSLHPVANQ